MEEACKILEITGLSKKYGDKKVLDNISFCVNRGEVVGFLGPNGAGKSTTMNIITGYLSPTSGSVKVCGTDILENPIEARKKIGYLPEIPPVYADMTVDEYMDFVFDLKKCTLNKKEHINDCIEQVKIANVRSRIIKNLSKGYQQRVGIAQALIGEPELLILDEPTVGLDPNQIGEIRDLILSIGQKRTVLLSTHILQEVSAVCDKAVIIRNGVIMASDSLKNLEQSNIYEISVIGSADDTYNAICNLLPDIHINTDNGISTFECDADAQKRAEISTLLMSNNLPVVEMTNKVKSVEDIFKELTV